MKKLKDIFPFEYVGGGYFRMRGIQKGIAAPMLHGQEAIEELFAIMSKEKDVPNEKTSE